MQYEHGISDTKTTQANLVCSYQVIVSATGPKEIEGWGEGRGKDSFQNTSLWHIFES